MEELLGVVVQQLQDGFMQKLRKELIVVNGIKIKLKYEDLKEFIKITTSFESNIDMIKDRYVIDARSIMGIMSLDFTQPTMVVIHSVNEDEIVRFYDEMKRFAI